MTNFTELNPVERERVYVFPDGDVLSFKNVVRLAVSERGTHRLELADGTKVIIPPKWIAIELDVDAWSL
jgi:hypothetical protein